MPDPAASVPAIQAGQIFRAAIEDVVSSARTVLKEGQSLTVDLEVTLENLQVSKSGRRVRIFQRKTNTETSSVTVRLATRLLIDRP